MAHKRREDFEFNDKLSFTAVWNEAHSDCHKNFIFNYYPSDNTVELYDTDLSRVFLKRVKMENIEMRHIYPGNIVRIYGRPIQVLDYANCYTKTIFGKVRDRTTLIILPLIKFHDYGKIITALENYDFQIINLRRQILNRGQGLSLYEYLAGEPVSSGLIDHIISGPSVGCEIIGDNAVNRINTLLGPLNPEEARKVSPNSLRAIYGKERGTNAFHMAETAEAAEKEVSVLFPRQKKEQKELTVYNNTTLCVIKPHIIKNKQLGEIISLITDSGFTISSMEMFYMSPANIDEFLEVYKGVVSDFCKICNSFLDGPCVAMEIGVKSESANAHGEFRKFCGPSDPDIARQIRPNTLRAKFGVDKFDNAVHCTDLPEDAVLEIEYFFKILQ